MNHVSLRISQGQARAFFGRRRWGNLFGLYGRLRPELMRAVEDGTGPPCFELIWLPHYLIDFSVDSRKGPGVVSVSVDACSGCFAFFRMHDDLSDVGVMGAPLPPLMEEKAAVAHGRGELLCAIMRRRGQQGKPVIQDAVKVGVFYYPFWLLYVRRFQRYVDVLLQDGVSGERGGNRTKKGILDAFVQLRGGGVSSVG